MNYTTLGKSPLKVSQIGFGCMSLSEDHAANANLLNRAFDAGITFYDTADLYQKGFNEETLGKAFHDRRQQIVIATKVGNQWRSDGSGWDWNPTKAYILQAVEQSLRRLRTDYIDLYQLHGGTIEDPINETIEAFERLQQQGKIRAYGISSIRPNVIREYAHRSSIASVMMQYSLLDRRPEESCLALLQKEQIGVLVRGSLAQGLLAGKEAKSYLGYSAEEVGRMATAVRRTAGQDRNAAAVATGYVLHASAVSSVVLGIRAEEQLTQAVAIGAAPPLTKDEITALAGTLKPLTYEQHR